MPTSDILAGQRALVTGASGNIGRASACRRAAEGADVLVHFHKNQEGATKTVDEITSAGGNAMRVQADLSSEEQATELFDGLSNDGPPITCVVNNAALQTSATLPELDGDEWRKVMAANLDSAFYVTQSAARYLASAGQGGAIVNIASIEGSDPASGHSHYATSKAGLLMLTRACALEYGPAGIRCNAVSPGLIDEEGLADTWPDGVNRWLGKAPLGRMGSSNDVAAATFFLLSPESAWISGANLVVDGGMSSVSRW